MKAQVRKLTNNTADRRIWTVEWRVLHKLFKRKRTVDTIAKIQSEKDNPKRLWRTLNPTVGLTEVVQELTHRADQFLDFIIKEIEDIRVYITNAPLSVFNASPHDDLSKFNKIVCEQIVSVIIKSPCKHSQLDPLPGRAAHEVCVAAGAILDTIHLCLNVWS